MGENPRDGFRRAGVDERPSVRAEGEGAALRVAREMSGRRASGAARLGFGKARAGLPRYTGRLTPGIADAFRVAMRWKDLGWVGVTFGLGLAGVRGTASAGTRASSGEGPGTGRAACLPRGEDGRAGRYGFV